LQSEELLLFAEMPRFYLHMEVKLKVKLCVCLRKHRAVEDSSKHSYVWP